MRVAEADPDREVRLLALATLADLGHRASIPALLTALGSDDLSARRHAIRGLANTRANEVVQPLIATLADPKPAIRAAAAHALADLGDASAVDPLRAALRHTWRPFLRVRLRLALDRLSVSIHEDNPSR